MTVQKRMEETIGGIDKRLLILESKSLWGKWEEWFGKHPGIVIGVIIVTIVSGAWMFHTWVIDRLDREQKEEIASLEKRHKSNVTWLEKKQKQNLFSLKERCEVEKEKFGYKIEQCNIAKNITDKDTGRSEAAPVL